jgi:hypothetical protein
VMQEVGVWCLVVMTEGALLNGGRG